MHDLKRDLPFDEVISKLIQIFFKAKEILSFMYRIAEECSIIHYHGTIFVRNSHLFEGPLFRKSRIPMIITFREEMQVLQISNQLNQCFIKIITFFMI